ncbi:MAG: hypothetical protein ACOC46_04400, partial [Pirellulales bacterium]
TASADQTVKVWNLEDGTLRATFEGHDAPVTALAVAGDLAISADEAGQVLLWGAGRGESIDRLDLDSPVRSIALSADGRRLLAGCRNGRVRLAQIVAAAPADNQPAQERAERFRFQPADDDEQAAPLEAGSDVLAVAVSADGTLAATAGADRRLLLWNLADRRATPLPGTLYAPGRGLAFSPDGRRFIAGTGLLGAKVGPELTDVAGRQPWTYLQESLMQPSKVIVTQYESYLIVLDDGRQKVGRIIEGDVQAVVEGRQQTGTLVLAYLGGATGNELLTEPVAVERIARRGDVGLENAAGTDADQPAIFRQDISVMPANFRTELTVEAFTNLMAFLLTLTGEPGQPRRQAALSPAPPAGLSRATRSGAPGAPESPPRASRLTSTP